MPRALGLAFARTCAALGFATCTGACGAKGTSPSTGGTSGTGGVSGTGGANGTSGTGGIGGGGTGGAGGASSTRPIEAGPTYLGTLNNAAGCTQQYVTSGFEPVAAPGARHPLFLYFSGTNFFNDAVTFRQGVAPGAGAVTETMARRGFVALWVEYDNSGVAWASDHVNQLSCLFGDGPTDSVLDVACRLPQVDCGLGIAMWGHSQGAYVAHMAGNFDARVRAVWLTGYGGDAKATLVKNRLRVVNGEADTSNGTVAVLNPIAGFTATECPDDGRKQCLRTDGSGWIIVQRVDCQVSTADHCWFDRRNCLDTAPALEPNWIDPASTKPFALETNADWVAETARRP